MRLVRRQLERAGSIYREYPSQFWILVLGTFIAGCSCCFSAGLRSRFTRLSRRWASISRPRRRYRGASSVWRGW